MNYPTVEFNVESYRLGQRTVEDPLLYLTDGTSGKTLDFTKRENEYTDAYFALRGKKLERYIARAKERLALPAFLNVRVENGGIYAMKRDADGTLSAVTLDSSFNVASTLFAGEDYPEGKIYNVVPCPGNSSLVAIWTLKSRAARMTALVRDIKRNVTLAELDKTFDYCWSADGSRIYYAEAVERADRTLENRIRSYVIATGRDEILYTDGGNAVFVLVSPRPDGGVAAAIKRDYGTNDLIIISASGEARKLGLPACSFDYIGSDRGLDLYLTDLDAPHGRIVSMKESDSRAEEAKTVFEAEEGSLTAAAVIGGKLVTIQNENASGRLRVRETDGSNAREVALPDEFGTPSEMISPSDGKEFYIGYASFTTPDSVLLVNVETASSKLVYSSGEVAKGIKTELRFMNSFDGERIAAFLVYREGTEKSPSTPALMYGYGGYNVANPPEPKAVDMSIADFVLSGGLYVHCILRGGNEFGDEWHRDGMLLKKKNVFADMAAIADYLIREGWTSREKLAISGLSNGGLLVCATTMLYPQYFACALASVPHTDMLHFALDDRGSMYVTEYGDPREDEYYEYMRSYSPYHNIKGDTEYPAFYIQTGEYDNNVPPYHGKKFAAALQALGGEKPVLLRVLPYGSHDRGAGEYHYRTVAELELFRDEQLGIEREDGE